MNKRLLEGATPADRAQKRQQLGKLSELTVQPATRLRYQSAIDAFLHFLHQNSLVLPTQRDLLDPLVCEFIEHLWSSGGGRGRASDCVAGLQNHDPKIRGHLPGAWRLLKTWSINEVPNRAPPLPEHVLHSMVGWATFHGHHGFAVSLLVGFYGMLRTGELLTIYRKDFMVDEGGRKVLLALGWTKGGKRAGAAESVVLGHDAVVKPLLRWMKLTSSATPLTPSPPKWRSLFNQAIVSLKITSFEFRPYSLRRGGATWWFSKHHSLDKILLQGRWQAAKTARMYINEGLSILAQIKLPSNHPSLKPFLTVYRTSFIQPTFSTLEPPSGRAGGRGKKGKKAKSTKSSRKEKGFVLRFSLRKGSRLGYDRGVARRLQGGLWFVTFALLGCGLRRFVTPNKELD